MIESAIITIVAALLVGAWAIPYFLDRQERRQLIEQLTAKRIEAEAKQKQLDQIAERDRKRAEAHRRASMFLIDDQDPASHQARIERAMNLRTWGVGMVSTITQIASAQRGKSIDPDQLEMAWYELINRVRGNRDANQPWTESDNLQLLEATLRWCTEQIEQLTTADVAE